MTWEETGKLGGATLYRALKAKMKRFCFKYSGPLLENVGLILHFKITVIALYVEDGLQGGKHEYKRGGRPAGRRYSGAGDGGLY